MKRGRASSSSALDTAAHNAALKDPTSLENDLENDTPSAPRSAGNSPEKVSRKSVSFDTDDSTELSQVVASARGEVLSGPPTNDTSETKHLFPNPGPLHAGPPQVGPPSATSASSDDSTHAAKKTKYETISNSSAYSSAYSTTTNSADTTPNTASEPPTPDETSNLKGANNDLAYHQQQRGESIYDAATPLPNNANPQQRSAKSNGGSGGGSGKDFLTWSVGDRYQLMRILGHGSYGEVAQARDLQSDLPEGQNYVAIKRISSIFDQEIDAKRIYREMYILRCLRQNCIIKLLDVVSPKDFESFNDLYLVFEYVDTDLYKLIMSPQYLTTEHIQTFLYQLLTGLKFIHDSSVIHRDLKPANILLNEDCSLKICDFGLARVVSSESMMCSSGEGDGSAEDQKNAENTDNSLSKGPEGYPRPKGLTRQLTKHVVTRW